MTFYDITKFGICCSCLDFHMVNNIFATYSRVWWMKQDAMHCRCLASDRFRLFIPPEIEYLTTCYAINARVVSRTKLFEKTFCRIDNVLKSGYIQGLKSTKVTMITLLPEFECGTGPQINTQSVALAFHMQSIIHFDIVIFCRWLFHWNIIFICNIIIHIMVSHGSGER